MLSRAEEEARSVVVSGEVFELPEFVVAERPELPPAESWLYAETPGFEILSSISPSRTQRFTRDFQRLQQAIDTVWPALSTRAGTSVPVMIVLCGSRDFRAFAPPQGDETSNFNSSRFFSDSERQAIVVAFAPEWQNFAGIEDEEADGRADTLALSLTMQADPYRAFYLQYFRYLIRRSVGITRPWLEEGMVQLMASIEFSRKHAAIGKLGNDAPGFGGTNGSSAWMNSVAGGPMAGGAITGGEAQGGYSPASSGVGSASISRDFNRVLARQALMDFSELFASDRPKEASSYAMQCYAFVHLCLFGQGKKYQAPFADFVRRTAAEPASEAIFRECFGQTYRQMERVLRDYIDFTAYEPVEFRGKNGSDAFPELPLIDVREAIQAEVGRIKGETFRLAGQPEPARKELIAAYVRGEKDPRLLAALGLHERGIGRDARARKFLEAAAAARVERPRAYLELARLRLAEEKARAGDGGRLSRLQVVTVLAPLHTGCSQLPPMAELYETIAEVWLATDETPSREDLRQLYGGAHRFPTQLKLIYLAAAVAVRAGDAVNARVLIDHGIEHAPSEPVRARFRELEARLPSRAPEPPEATAPVGKGAATDDCAVRNNARATPIALGVVAGRVFADCLRPRLPTGRLSSPSVFPPSA